MRDNKPQNAKIVCVNFTYGKNYNNDAGYWDSDLLKEVNYSLKTRERFYEDHLFSTKEELLKSL